jgi:hypothetical protein
MDEACATLNTDLPSLVCTCTRAYVEDNWDALSEETLNCINENIAEPVDVPSPLLRGPFKQMAIKMLQEVALNYRQFIICF